MIFISGPRQVGKTYLSRQEDGAYFNWDDPSVKKKWLADPYFFRSTHSVVVFDEIHKRRDWKRLLKGYYDSPDRKENFIVTGSGRFDQYQRGGDSLQGRYFGYTLNPLIPAETFGLSAKNKLALPRDWKSWTPDSHSPSDESLIRFGGFPATFLKASESWLNRWQNEYLLRLVREDTRDFSLVEKLDKLELLARILPQRVMSPLSIKSLSEDIEVSPVAVKSWLRLFEVLYFGFSLAPFTPKIHRAVKREKKWYFYPWTLNEEPAARFENYMAIQLKAVLDAWTEQGRGVWELFYLRDQDRREVDFCICKDLKPVALVEVKLKETTWTAGLNYYCRKLGVPGFLVTQGGETRRNPLGWTVPSYKFLHGLVVTG